MMRALHKDGAITARLLGALLLYVVALRAVIPTALMLDQDAATGKLAIVLCAAQAGAPVLFDPATGELSDTSDAGHDAVPDGSCPFALAAMPVLPAAHIILAATSHAQGMCNACRRSTKCAPPTPDRLCRRAALLPFPDAIEPLLS